MTKEKYQEYIDKMKSAIDNGDTELSHVLADDILCEFIKELGYEEIVEIYLDVSERWYA